jgi:hypothetical protein
MHSRIVRVFASSVTFLACVFARFVANGREW